MSTPMRGGSRGNVNWAITTLLLCPGLHAGVNGALGLVWSHLPTLRCAKAQLAGHPYGIAGAEDTLHAKRKPYTARFMTCMYTPEQRN